MRSRRRPLMSALMKRIGSAVPGVAADPRGEDRGRAESQSARSVVFPAPGAPTTSVSRMSAPRSSSVEQPRPCYDARDQGRSTELRPCEAGAQRYSIGAWVGQCHVKADPSDGINGCSRISMGPPN